MCNYFKVLIFKSMFKFPFCKFSFKGTNSESVLGLVLSFLQGLVTVFKYTSKSIGFLPSSEAVCGETSGLELRNLVICHLLAV